MINIRYLLHRGGLLIVRQELHSGSLVQAQSVTQPKHVLKTTIYQLELNSLPSHSIVKSFMLDAKKTKLYRTPDKSKKSQGKEIKFFTPEEDQKLLDHVREHGISRKYLKDVAKSLDRSYSSVKHRCSKLMSINKYETNSDRKGWNYAEDEKLVNSVLQQNRLEPSNISLLMDIKESEFKNISPDLERSSSSLYMRWRRDIVPCLEPHLEDLSSSKNLMKDILKLIEVIHERSITVKGYTEEDKKFIIKQVELKGDIPETWVFIAKKLGKKVPGNVKDFYHNYILQAPKVKGSYTTEEDEVILNHVKANGRTKKSFSDLAKKLGRGSFSSVKSRHDRLVLKSEFEVNTKRKTWALDEDKSLIDHVYNIKEIKEGDASSIENVKQSSFNTIAADLKRSSSSCYSRWMQHIVPVLKTYLKKLPLTNDWKKDVLSHIVENNIKDKKKMDIAQVLKEIAPGQTSISLLLYLDRLKKERVDGVEKQSKLPLCDLASKVLKEQSPSNSLFNDNHKGEQKRLEWCQDVILYYETFKVLDKNKSKVIKQHHDSDTSSAPNVKGLFTPEEDEMILRHVNENGTASNSFKDLAHELGRCSPRSVKNRYKKLIAANEFEINSKLKVWELDEDKSLINHIFNIKEIQTNDAPSFENVKESELITVAKELKRSYSSCYRRWTLHIVPTLKTHLKKLPMTNDWKKDVLLHIVKNNVQHKKEIDIHQVEKEIAPGQTKSSLLRYLEDLKSERVGGVLKKSKLSLCDLAFKKLRDQPPVDPLFNENHKGEQKRLEWCQDIISHYKTLI